MLSGLVMDYDGVLTDGGEVLALARRARAAPGLATAPVSDALAVPPEVAALFDVVVLGSALGARKPDPAVYRRVPERLALAPQQCVVVDDVAANLRGARAAGAVVVRHADPAATVFEVETLLGLP